MKTLNKIFAVLTFAVCTTSSMSFAQSAIVPGNLTSIETEILGLVTRPSSNFAGVNGAFAFHAILKAPLNMSCMSATGGAGAQWSVIFSDRTDFKLVKETLQMAYVLKKKVRVYAAQCANFSSPDPTYQYPVIYGVDMSD